MNYRQTLNILLFFNVLWAINVKGQNPFPIKIRLSHITFLTQNLDSLTRSFIKKGFHIKDGKREPSGVFNNSIKLQDGTEILLESTTSQDSDNWRVQTLKKYGSYISGIAFIADNIDSISNLLIGNDIPCRSKSLGRYGSYLALDSLAPLDVVFIQKDSSSSKIDSLAYHPNHVFRVDWLLLSSSPTVESRLRKIFEITGAIKQHEGCCDYWRVGPADDFCFFRFDPLPPKAKGENNWLSIEPDGIYFAY